MPWLTLIAQIASGGRAAAVSASAPLLDDSSNS
ncbi:hypothetical protein QE412_001682 [Microbacterium trichothecenolyticum]|uniref:Uncharacterized protein n=1 Tax=Microbacterium trichothecenolyticum TaxID=69370 RepID=A0ABU0TVZ9_MICTR|nr:hypothetical protein [Microbacterium trichothecenolyticum]